MVRMLRATRVKRVGGPGSGLTVAAIAALVVAGLHSTVDFGMEIQANMFLLLSLVALGMTRPGLAGPK